MQNKPNFPCFSPENDDLRKNKPNSNPIQTQFNPIQTQFKPKQTQTKPISVSLASFIVYNDSPSSCFRQKSGVEFDKEL